MDIYTLVEVYYQTGAQSSFRKQLSTQEQMHKIKTLSIFKQEHFQILKATPKHLLKTAKIQSRFKSSNTLLKSAKEQKSSVVPGLFICLSSCISTSEPLTDRALSAFSSKPRYPRCRALSLLLYSRVGRPHLRKLRHLWSTAVVNKSKERSLHTIVQVC